MRSKKALDLAIERKLKLARLLDADPDISREDFAREVGVSPGYMGRLISDCRDMGLLPRRREVPHEGEYPEAWDRLR